MLYEVADFVVSALSTDRSNHPVPGSIAVFPEKNIVLQWRRLVRLTILAIPEIGILMVVPGLIKEAMTLSVGSKKKVWTSADNKNN